MRDEGSGMLDDGRWASYLLGIALATLIRRDVEAMAITQGGKNRKASILN